MRLILRVVLLAFAAAALLVGIQVPNFADQYAKRVDAHLVEVKTNLAPFQEIADRLHGGSLEQLIVQHETSEDPTFHAEGQAIRQMQQRVALFENEQAHMQAGLVERSWWLATGADPVLIGETRYHYSFGLMLDRAAVIAGIALMLAVVVALEGVAWIGTLLFTPRRRSSFSPSHAR